MTVRGPWPQVVILDSRGELASVYREATVAFVGGTLVPIGGHNLLEPAFWAKPVLFGPYTDHCVEIANLLVQADGGRRVSTAEELSRSSYGCWTIVKNASVWGKRLSRWCREPGSASGDNRCHRSSIGLRRGSSRSASRSPGSFPLMAGR